MNHDYFDLLSSCLAQVENLAFQVEKLPDRGYPHLLQQVKNTLALTKKGLADFMELFTLEHAHSTLTLNTLQNWSDTDHALLQKVESLWYGEEKLVQTSLTSHPNTPGRFETWTFHTDHWSCNEELIRALQRNRSFWSRCWRSSTSLGKHEFELL